MIRKLFIWWHRRRAAHHDAAAAYRKAEGDYPAMQKHIVWSRYHELQIRRLENLQLSSALGEQQPADAR